MSDIDDKDDEDDEDDDDQHVGSVCGDYREHQVTSSALPANDRAPMNRRKKSRQTDSFGIDRKIASKLRQTDILCIDRKRSSRDRETDIFDISSFFMKFCFGMNTIANESSLISHTI